MERTSFPKEDMLSRGCNSCDKVSVRSGACCDNFLCEKGGRKDLAGYGPGCLARPDGGQSGKAAAQKSFGKNGGPVKAAGGSRGAKDGPDAKKSGGKKPAEKGPKIPETVRVTGRAKGMGGGKSAKVTTQVPKPDKRKKRP